MPITKKMIKKREIFIKYVFITIVYKIFFLMRIRIKCGSRLKSLMGAGKKISDIVRRLKIKKPVSSRKQASRKASGI